jgi:hypothetical protein
VDDPIRKQLRDLKKVEETLFAKEGTLDLYISNDHIKTELERLRNTLSREVSILEQFKAYSKLISDLGCGHTQVHPNKRVYRAWLAERSTLPMDYFLFGRRLITNELDAKDKSSILALQPHLKKSPLLQTGTEILSIDDNTVEQMMTGIGEFLSSDEDHQSFKFFQARNFFEFYRHLDNPLSKDSVKIVYIHNSDTLTEWVNPGTAPVNTMNKRIFEDQSAQLNDETDMGSFKVIKNKYGYFRFKSFVASSGGDYNLFLEESFSKLKDNEIEHLVIDLRGNTGGVMQYDLVSYFTGPDVPLGSYIVSKPRDGATDKGIKKLNGMYLRHILLSKKQEQEIRTGRFGGGKVNSRNVDTSLVYKGQVVVITDEGTFSSAAILASHLKSLCNAKIVGRTAGGSFYGGNSGTLLVRLPSSKLSLLVNPNTFKSQLVSTADPIQIKLPDRELHPKFMTSKKLDAYYFREATRSFDQND